MVLFSSLMIDLCGILMLLYMTSSRIFENVTAKWTSSVKHFFWGGGQKLSKGANIKNQSVTIAFFFFSSPFFLLVLSFSPFLFLG